MILERKKKRRMRWMEHRSTHVRKYMGYLYLLVLQQQHRNLSINYDMCIYRLREQFGSSSGQLIRRSFAYKFGDYH